MAGKSQGLMLIAGPCPPPLNGVSLITTYIRRYCPEFPVFDTARFKISIKGMSRFTLGNLLASVRMIVSFTLQGFRLKYTYLYVPISQSRWGFIRDLVLFSLSRRRAKVILHIHGGHFPQTYANLSVLERRAFSRLLKRVAAVIVLHDVFVDEVKRIVGDIKVIPIPNGVEPTSSGVTLRSRTYSEETAMKLLYVGGLMKAKGVLDAIRAVGLLREQGCFVNLYLAGEWESTTTHQEAQSLKGYSHTFWNGTAEAEDKKRLFSDADAFVMPTYYPFEGQPLSLLEALSASLPIVTTRHAAIAETVGEEAATYVCPKDPEGLAAAIRRLYESVGTRHHMSEMAYRRFSEERFSAQGFAERFRHSIREITQVND